MQTANVYVQICAECSLCSLSCSEYSVISPLSSYANSAPLLYYGKDNDNHYYYMARKAPSSYKKFNMCPN